MNKAKVTSLERSPVLDGGESVEDVFNSNHNDNDINNNGPQCNLSCPIPIYYLSTWLTMIE